MNDEIEKIQSDLLILSLSIGQSIDLEKNCDNFITFLSSWKNFQNISVWVKDSLLPDKRTSTKTRLIVSTNINDLSINTIGKNHIIYDKLSSSAWCSINSNDVDYEEFNFGKKSSKGIQTFLKLGEVGFIRLTSDSDENVVITKEEIDPLLIVISKFTTSIKACIAYKESLFEKENAKKEAALAIKSKSRFLNTMTHEIRDPMNAIYGLTEMLRSTGLSNTQKNIIDKLTFSSNNLVFFLNEIIDFSKLEAGQLDVEKSVFKAEELVQSAMADVENIALPKSISMEMEIDSWVKKPIVGDWAKINVVLVNLLRNAIQFSDKGIIKILVKPVSIFTDSVQLRFVVQDEGVGIESKRFDEIFNSYFIEDTKSNFGTRKIGLALSKMLIELMGGTISVESKVGKGSTFSFVLEFSFDVDGKYDIATDKRKVDPKKSSKIKVLLVEISPLNQEITLDYLSDWDVTLAENGKKALEILKNNKDFSIILMNLRMDNLDGVAASKIIKQKLKLDIPIIAITTEPSSSITNACRRVGMDDLIIKPFTKKHLIERIVDNLGDSNIYLKVEDDVILEVFKGKTVLLVDDDMITQLTTQTLLENCNFNVVVCDGGAEALEEISKQDFDLIISDLFMPDMDGFEFSKKVRAQGIDTPIIAFSSDDSKQTQQLCNNIGVNKLLVKKIYKKMEWAKEIYKVVQYYEGF